jgi:hypothetical protein
MEYYVHAAGTFCACRRLQRARYRSPELRSFIDYLVEAFAPEDE